MLNCQYNKILWERIYDKIITTVSRTCQEKVDKENRQLLKPLFKSVLNRGVCNLSFNE